MACGTQSPLLSVTTSFPILSLLAQSFYPRVSQSGFVTSAQTLIHDNLCPPSFGKWHSKSSNLLSLSPTLLTLKLTEYWTTAHPFLAAALLPTF